MDEKEKKIKKNKTGVKREKMKKKNEKPEDT